MKKKMLSALFAAWMLNAVAQDSGVYVLSSLGSGDSSGQGEVKRAFEGAGLTRVESSVDSAKPASKLQLGYRLSDHFAVEGGYFDLGKASYRVTTDQRVGADVALKISGWSLSGLGVLPLGKKFSLFGRMGVAFSSAKSNSVITIPGLGSSNQRGSGSKTGLLYGAGLGYDITSALSLRGEYEVYDKVGGGSFGGVSRAKVWLLGMAWRF
jgi:OOP family OmpA-OmpF porin